MNILLPLGIAAVAFLVVYRDFTNVQLLYGGQAVLFLSVLITGVHGRAMQAPPMDIAGGEAVMHGGLWPILFITVACGAISGFHSLVASGTTVRQLPRESDGRTIGYGAMLVESVLAISVLVAVAAALPRPIFGAGNQLVGALALTTVSVWLAQRARRNLFALIPAVFMIVTTIAALWLQMERNLGGENPVLGVMAGALLLLAVGVVAVGVARFSQALQSPAPRSMVAVAD